jgi:hypothetical protein
MYATGSNASLLGSTRARSGASRGGAAALGGGAAAAAAAAAAPARRRTTFCVSVAPGLSGTALREAERTRKRTKQHTRQSATCTWVQRLAPATGAAAPMKMPRFLRARPAGRCLLSVSVLSFNQPMPCAVE